jgi:uncharacterized protein involved in outer membrane biogenesis
LKKVLIGVAGLFVLLVAAVLIGPSFIDWNAYKGQIVAAIRDNTGRAAAIDGDIAFSVLPAPALRVAGLRIANFEGAQSTDMLKLKELRVRVSIAALLERRVVVEQLELIEPVIALEVNGDGKASWDIEIVSGEAESSAQSAINKDAPLDISLANVMIRGGVLSFRDARSGTFETVDSLEVAVSAPSLAGPFDVTASARARAVPLTVKLKTGALKAGQPLTLSVKAVLPEADAEIRFNGRMLDPVPTGLLSGKLEIEGSDAARLASSFVKEPLPPFLAQAVSLNGMVMVSPDAVALNDTAIRLGAFSGNGAVSVTLGETVNADIAVSVSRLNLDELLAQSIRAENAPAKSATADSAAKSETPKPPLAEPFSLPRNVNASFDLAIDVVQYRDGVIREVGLRAGLANGAVTLDRASALLPGGSDVSLLGFLSVIEDEPRFEGEVAVASDNLRALLAWAGADTSTLPSDRLRGFSYASKVTVTPAALEVPDINIRLDASTMTGGLAVALRERPGFGLRLSIDRLNLDAYTPRSSKAKVASGSKKDTTAATNAGASATANPLAFLNSFDANIDARVERLTVRKTVARKARFDALLVGGTLSVRKSSVADFAGLQVEVTGDVKGLSTTPSVKLDYRVAVTDPDRLFRFMGTPSPIARGKLGKPTASGSVEGNVGSLKIKSDLKGASVNIQFEGVVKNPVVAPAFDLGVALNHPETVRFIRLISPEFSPAAKTLGPLAAAFRVAGAPSDFQVSGLDAVVGPVTVKGNAAIKTGGSRPFIRADLATSEILLDLFQPVPKRTGAATARGRAAAANGATNTSSATLAGSNGRWSRDPIDLSVLRGVDADIKLRMAGLISDRIRLSQPSLEAVLKDGRLDLRQFKAGLFGGSLSANGSADAAARVPAIAANVTASNLDLATAAKTFGQEVRVAGPLSIDASLKTAGNSVAAFVSSLGGAGKLSGKVKILTTKKEDRALGAIGLASALFGNKVRELKQAGGLTSILVQAFGRTPASLSGNLTIERGVVRTQDTVLSGTGARALTTGAVNLPRWLIDTNTAVSRDNQDTQAPYVSVALTGPLDSPNFKTGGSFLSSSNNKPASSSPLQQILPNVLGNQAGSSSEKPQKVQPQDILRGLLKGLGR